MTNAARTLGIQRPNLYRKARQLGIPLTRVAE
jgi:transcriptional regulator of acetoin/glycerol metabolism